MSRSEMWVDGVCVEVTETDASVPVHFICVLARFSQTSPAPRAASVPATPAPGTTVREYRTHMVARHTSQCGSCGEPVYAGQCSGCGHATSGPYYN